MSMSIPWWLLLGDRLAVVLSGLSQIDGCGFVSHVVHMDGAPASVSSEARDFVVLVLYASPAYRGLFVGFEGLGH
jgi:hypothetical protein